MWHVTKINMKFFCFILFLQILELYSLSVVCHVTKLDLKFFCFLLYPQILELPSHPFYVGVQFHPEFKSRPGRPSALFLGNCQLTTEPCTC